MRHKCGIDGDVEIMTETAARHSSDEPSKPGLGQAEHPTAQATHTPQPDEQQQEEEDHEAWKIGLIDR